MLTCSVELRQERPLEEKTAKAKVLLQNMCERRDPIPAPGSKLFFMHQQ